MAANIRAGRTDELHRPKQPTVDYAGSPWVIVDIGFSSNSRSCGVTINGNVIPDPVEGYRCTTSTPDILGDKHYGMLSPAITQWLAHHHGLRENHPVNLMIEAPLSMAFARRSEPGEKLQGVHQGNPVARAPDRLGNAKHNGLPPDQRRLWYTQPGSGLMIASCRLIQELITTLDGCEIRLFEGFVSFKEGEGPKGHWRDTCKLWHALPAEDAENRLLSRPIIDSQKHTAQSVLALIGLDSTDEVPPVLRVTGSADKPVVERYALY